MESLRVAIIGAGKIGTYHAEKFMLAGAEVKAIVCEHQDSAKQKALYLNAMAVDLNVPGISIKPFWDLEDMLDKTELDAVAICTPTNAHAEPCIEVLRRGINVLLEKPVHWNFGASPEDNLAVAEILFRRAEDSDVLLTVNTQLTAFHEPYLKFTNRKPDASVSAFYYEHIMPSIGTDLEIAADLLPHAISMLLKMTPDIMAYKPRETAISLTENIWEFRFPVYRKEKLVDVTFKLGKIPDVRVLKFGVDGVYINRETRKVNGTFVNYLVTEEGSQEVDDPLQTSIVRFCDTVRRIEGLPYRGDPTPLVLPYEAKLNIRIQAELMKQAISYLKPQNPPMGNSR